MMFERPVSFAEAVAYMRRKRIFPTDMTTQELRELDAAFREQAFFSARNVFEDVLQGEKEAIESILNPNQVKRADRATVQNPEGWVSEGFNPATARVRIKALLNEAGYQPSPDERGTVTDLSSSRRINLVVDTNERLSTGYGFKRQGDTETLRKTRPAWELYRQEARLKKRAWLQRFRMAGELTGDPIGIGWTITKNGLRMVALKDHPIWTELGSSLNFSDALDVDYPPFAFNSGMWVKEVTREEMAGDADMAKLLEAPRTNSGRVAESGFKVGGRRTEDRGQTGVLR